MTTPDMTVDGSTIDVDTNTNDLHAQGSVTTRSPRSPAARPHRRARCSRGDEPIIGGADTLRYTKSTGTAFYTGTARAQAQLEAGRSPQSSAIESSSSTPSRNLNAERQCRFHLAARVDRRSAGRRRR